jgi:hypothetical protein
MRRLAAFLPRLVVLTIAWLLATAALTYAAGKRMSGAVTPTRQPVTPQPRRVIVVPDVRKQAYVFAKGILGDAGFAWKVQGAVEGFAANTVASQSPLPGTRVVATGAPTIVLHLQRGGRQNGSPENVAPFPGTAIQLADAAVNRVRIPRATLGTTKARPARKAGPVTKPKAVEAPAARRPQRRPPAFTVPGGKPEPLTEMPLPDRAAALLRWVGTKPAPTDANVSHWLYQHQWIIAGARLGWWRGDEALKTLLEADRRVWDLWGIGARSADLTRRTLAEVQARSR